MDALFVQGTKNETPAVAGVFCSTIQSDYLLFFFLGGV